MGDAERALGLLPISAFADRERDHSNFRRNQLGFLSHVCPREPHTVTNQLSGSIVEQMSLQQRCGWNATHSHTSCLVCSRSAVHCTLPSSTPSVRMPEAATAATAATEATAAAMTVVAMVAVATARLGMC